MRHLAGLDRTPADQLGEFSYSVGLILFFFFSLLFYAKDVMCVWLAFQERRLLFLLYYSFFYVLELAMQVAVNISFKQIPLFLLWIL